MRNSIILFAILLNLQAFGQQYWQQEVNYTISVTLNDVDHTLTGYEEFVYTNNSPDVLTEMYIHLWPNAYRDGNSALGKQLYRNGEMDLNYGFQTSTTLNSMWMDKWFNGNLMKKIRTSA
jgi:hypothetical protein